jgi:hypothetical protein
MAKETADKPTKKQAAEPAPALANPDIHFLQAERATLQANRNALAALPDPSEAIAELDKQIAAIDKLLAG